MKRLAVILITLLLLTGCTAATPNEKHSARTNVESSAEWDALFSPEKLKNVTVIREGLAFSGKETLKRNGSTLFLSGSYEGDKEDYCQYYYEGEPYTTLIQKDLGSWYAALISRKDADEYGDYLASIMMPVGFEGLYEKTKYNEEKDAYEFPYEFSEMKLDATVYTEDGLLNRLALTSQGNSIIDMSFSDYGETAITETPGSFTVDEDGWNRAVAFDGSIPFNLYETSLFQGKEYHYNLQTRPYAIRLEQSDSDNSEDLVVYYGVEDGITNGEMYICDYISENCYGGSEEAQVDVPSLMNTLIDNFTLNYRFANAAYSEDSHTYTFDVSRYGENAVITLVFLDGRLLAMRNDKAGGDWIESHYGYDHLEEITPPGVG